MLFAAKPPYGTPPFAPMPAPETGSAQPARTGLAGFIDRFVEPTNALGRLGKALVIAGGTPIGGAFAYMDRQREQDGEAQMRRAQFDLEMRKANMPQPTALQRNAEYLNSWQPGAGDRYLQAESNPMAALEVTDEAGGKQLRFYPKGGMPGSLGMSSKAVPPGAIDMLRKNPALAPQFDQKYGAGASAQYLGSAASQGADTFPDPMKALISQESGGRAGAVGPRTPYGRALGMTQMLPATARGVAGKLGLPYREDLLRRTDDLAAKYQRALGEAYFNEGLQATGNLRDAFRYYHGGPNRKLWGRKTNAYADAVLARMGA